MFGIVWLALGIKSQTPLELHDVVPPFSGLSSIVLIVSSFLAYAGMEVNAVHVNQTFKLFFGHLGAGWVSPVLAAAVAVGAFASVVTWIAGPSKGLLLAAETGVLPRVLQRRNAAGVQSGILMLQAVIVTVLAALFVVIPDVSVSFFTLVDMAAALYLIMYMLMFASAIVLRRTKPDVPRSYRVPAMTLVAGIGFAASLAAFLLGFVPPSGLSGVPASISPYVVGAVILALGAPPLVFYALRKPSWGTAEIGDDTHAGSIQAVLGITPP